MSRFVLVDESPSPERFVLEDGPAITMPSPKQRLENAYKEMADKNSFVGNLYDGMVTAGQRYALGGKQLIGRGTQAGKDELAAAEKAFGATVGGKVGDFIGTALPAIAATFIPGGNTIAGQALIGAGMGGAMPADSLGERAINVGLGGGIGAAAKVGGDKLASVLANRGAANAANATTQNAVRDAAITEARQAGYTIPPASANPTLLNRMTEGFAGKISTAQGAAIKNQPVTDALVRKSLGLADDAPLTRETLAGIRQQAGQLYAPVRGLGAVQADDAFLQTVDDIGARFQSAAKDFPSVVNKEAASLVESMKVKNFDANSAVDAIQALRENATGNLTPFAKGSEKTLGKAQKQLADALEAMLERHASANGQADAVQALREARVLIAKTYSVEKALREGTGSVSANKLAQQLAKGKPLSGELKSVATMGQNFPRAVQDVTSSMPGVSPLDFGLGGGIGAITGNPAAMLMVAGRPAVRSAILSGPFQRMAVNAPTYGPGLLGGAAPPLLRNPAAQISLTGGLLGMANE
ncbi:MAG: hypothetical protein ACOYKQ_07970 [Polymorphobacter sp.]